MKCQKELFSLREGVHYLNCAYKGPMLKASEEAGMKNLLRDRNPMDLQVDDYFEDNQKVRLYFGLLVNAPA